MTTVSEVLRSPTGGKSDVVERLVGLEEATDAARGRLDDHLVTEAADVAAHAEARLKLSGEHTVVALAGSTGSGKSSLFNQLCGLDLAAVGVKRPTTSWALGCAWGPDGAGELLDWVGVPKRHQTNRTSILDEAEAARDLHGLVLLDLPDHDSTEVSHHLEVQRLVGLADVLVWVVDPQKYADAALHDRYLRPLAPHADVLMVVLNHVDEMPADAVDPTMADLARLLHGDGLGAALVIATSATREDGLADLREAVATRVRQKKQASERLAADISAAAGAMAQQTGSGGPRDIGTSARGALVDACADAAGGSSALAAVQSTSRSQARRASSWPAARWLAWLRPAVGEQPDPAETASQSADESR
ncbi:MAG: GTPase, partial [Nocardioidaceae bacterium]